MVLSGFLRYVGNKLNFMFDVFGVLVMGNGIGWLYCVLMFLLVVLCMLCE